MPWGSRLDHNDEGKNDQWYASKPHDKGLDIDYSGARYYDPNIGRFLSPDPQGFKEQNPLTFNEYMYANDDPYGFGDPTGWYSWNNFMHDFFGGFGFGFGFGFGAGGTYFSPIVYHGASYIGAGVNSVAICIGARELWYGSEIAGQALDDIGDATWADMQSVKTPYGSADQEFDAESLALKNSIQNGRTVFRQGIFNESRTTDAQYWSPENPRMASDYANKYGIASEGSSPDWVMNAKINSNFITRVAPRYGLNNGGGIEAVTEPGGVTYNWFHMP